ncbi:MAG: assimilatory nitrite reductase small subunit [Frankiales bacterium]|jgi:nitrite reductase (NADH) small subunit|nr:assimilatory nitrite reductase small subunit [Frankiales bacterium]
MSWLSVVSLSEVPFGRAVCVLVDGTQVALVRLSDDSVAAVDNWDPVGRAMVMSRGIVGSRGGRDVLVSPLHKQAYDLETGMCLDQEGRSLNVHDVRVLDGKVEVWLAEAARRLA